VNQLRLPMDGIPIPNYMGQFPPWLEPKKTDDGWRFDCEPCHWVGETFDDRGAARRDAWLHVRGSLHRTGYRGPRREQPRLFGGAA
jgi:hypothetical protein